MKRIFILILLTCSRVVVSMQPTLDVDQYIENLKKEKESEIIQAINIVLFNAAMNEKYDEQRKWLENNYVNDPAHGNQIIEMLFNDCRIPLTCAFKDIFFPLLGKIKEQELENIINGWVEQIIVCDQESLKKEFLHKNMGQRIKISHQSSDDKQAFVKIVTKNTHDDILNTDKLVILKLSATWCPPCKLMAPVFVQLAQELQQDCVFATLDIDQEPDIAVRYKVGGIPAFIFIKNKKVIGNVMGLMSKHELHTKIKSYI